MNFVVREIDLRKLFFHFYDPNSHFYSVSVRFKFYSTLAWFSSQWNWHSRHKRGVNNLEKGACRFKEGMEEEYTLIHSHRSEFWRLVSKRDDFRETRNSHRFHSQHLSWTHTWDRVPRTLVEALDNQSTLQQTLFSLKVVADLGLHLHKNSGPQWESFDGCTREDLSSEIPWEHHILGRRKSSLPSTWRRDQRLDTKGDGKRNWMSAGQIFCWEQQSLPGTPQHPWTPHLPEDSSVQVPAEYLSTEVLQVPSSTLHQTEWEVSTLHHRQPMTPSHVCSPLEEWRSINARAWTLCIPPHFPIQSPQPVCQLNLQIMS